MSNSKSVMRTQRRKKQQAVEYGGGSCRICGYNRCLQALEFHHLDPKQKSFSPSYAILRRKWDDVKWELDKCLLLCRNCHAEVHYGMYKPEDLQQRLVKTITLQCGYCKNTFDTKNEEQIFCSSQCYKNSYTRRPTAEELQKLVWEMPSSKVARLFGVSDKAICKWCQHYGIPKPQRGYWAKTIAGGRRLVA